MFSMAVESMMRCIETAMRSEHPLMGFPVVGDQPRSATA